jgi:hypothetical protein
MKLELKTLRTWGVGLLVPVLVATNTCLPAQAKRKPAAIVPTPNGSFFPAPLLPNQNLLQPTPLFAVPDPLASPSSAAVCPDLSIVNSDSTGCLQVQRDTSVSPLFLPPATQVLPAAPAPVGSAGISTAVPSTPQPAAASAVLPPRPVPKPQCPAGSRSQVLSSGYACLAR